MTWLLRWATTLVDVIPKGDPLQWIVKKARERYLDWRKSLEFQETCTASEATPNSFG